MSALEVTFLVICIVIAALLVIGGIMLLLYAVIDRIVLKSFRVPDNKTLTDIPIKEGEYERIVYDPPIYID